MEKVDDGVKGLDHEIRGVDLKMTVTKGRGG